MEAEQKGSIGGTRVLPQHLERLKQLSIDTLDLSESTSALLKFYGLTHILDCVAFFCLFAQEREASARPRWARMVTLLFGDVRPKLMAAGYWDLALDADVWQVLNESYEIPHRRIVRWQGRDQDLYEIPLGRLSLDELYHDRELIQRLTTIGECVDQLLYHLNNDSEYWLEIDAYSDHFPASSLGHKFHEYLWGGAQPYLVARGYWRFVEEHVDDFKIWDEDKEMIDQPRFRFVMGWP